MTNLEWIKTLSAEELADWFYDEWLRRLQYRWSSSRGGLIIWLKDRKDEPTISKMEQVEDDAYFLELMGAVERGEIYDAGANQAWYEYINHKDEPQTYVINPQEPTNDDKCFECDDFFTCGGQCNKIEDEPQTERSE